MGSLPVNGNVHPVPKNSSGPCKFLSPFRERFTNRSPVESPPLSKKALHFFDTGKQVAKPHDNTISYFLNTRSMNTPGEHGKENPSILKAGSPRKSRSKDSANRKVNFKQNVLVFHFDRNEGGHVCSESQALSCEPQAKRSFAGQQQQQHQQQRQSPSTNSTFQHQNILQHDAGHTPRRLPSTGTPQPQRRPFLQENISEDSTTQIKDFHYVTDDNRSSILRFSLPLGLGISSTDVIVKANKTGNRVRVLSSDSRPTTNQRSREINERLGLPVRVDSYRISARMDPSGVLYVEAPVLPGELKPGLTTTRRST